MFIMMKSKQEVMFLVAFILGHVSEDRFFFVIKIVFFIRYFHNKTEKKNADEIMYPPNPNLHSSLVQDSQNV